MHDSSAGAFQTAAPALAVHRRRHDCAQVGCGNTFLASNSSCPPAEALTLPLLLGQLDALRGALGLQRVHLYGQGVGGMLALSYAAAKGGSAGGVVSVTAASCASSYRQLIADRRAAAAALGGDAVQLLDRKSVV